MPIKSKVFIQTLQKSQDRHKIRFSFESDNKNITKVFGTNLPPYTIKLDIPPDIIKVKYNLLKQGLYRIAVNFGTLSMNKEYLKEYKNELIPG